MGKKKKFALLNTNSICILLLEQRLEGFYLRCFLVQRKENCPIHIVMVNGHPPKLTVQLAGFSSAAQLYIVEY